MDTDERGFPDGKRTMNGLQGANLLVTRLRLPKAARSPSLIRVHPWLGLNCSGLEPLACKAPIRNLLDAITIKLTIPDELK
jgi:hypothetical protein